MKLKEKARKFVLQNRWKVYWSSLIFISLMTTAIAVIYWEADWNRIFLQLAGTLLAVYAPVAAMIVIMKDSNERIEKSTNDKLRAIQKLSQDQISANAAEFAKLVKTVNDSNNKQISKLGESTNLQINELKRTTQEQIKSNHEETERLVDTIIESNNKLVAKVEEEIETIRLTTRDQITSFVNQCQGIMIRSEENTAILAKLLEQQLKESLKRANVEFNRGKFQLAEIDDWTLFRTLDQKEEQLDRQYQKLHIKQEVILSIQSELKKLHQLQFSRALN